MNAEGSLAAPSHRPSITQGLTPYFLYALLVATIGPLLFGYHLAELNAPLNVLSCAESSLSRTEHSSSSLPQCIPMTAVEIGLITSIFTIGGLFGALLAGKLATRHGRLQAMRYTTIFFILGPLAESLANGVPVMAVGRFLSGVGAGAAVVVAPIYVSEIAPPGNKGFFGSFTQIMINFGIFITQLLGYFLSRDQLWRAILGVGGFIGLAQLAGLLFVVESPKWNADNGDANLAKETLQRLRGHDLDIQEEVAGWRQATAEDRRDEQQSLLENENRGTSEPASKNPNIKLQSVGIIQVMARPKYNRATLAVVVVMVAQQLCGINSIVMYGVNLLSNVLITSSALLNVFVAVVNLVVTFACAPLSDRLGRKPCLVLSISGMGISSLLLGTAILKHIVWLSILAVMTFVASFGLGLGPVPFILSSELVGAEAVGATQSWALAANWIATFVVAQFFPVVNKALGAGKIYFIFATFAAMFAAFVAWFVPETQGKRDADEVWGRERNQHRQED